MRRFSAAYLSRTRDGMWADSIAALSDLELPNRRQILDVGCGTGELTQVLAAGSQSENTDTAPARVVGLDADRSLLDVAQSATALEYAQGDATGIPFVDDAFDLVVCQALLINLPEPAAALEEFARVSSELVATIEPNNAHVGVDSTVEAEQRLEQTARDAFVRGVNTDVSIGDAVPTLFDSIGLQDISTARYHHQKRTEPPYSSAELSDAAAKASGSGLDDHATELRRGLDSETAPASYDELRSQWREMGRSIVEQMQEGSYRRVEIVPFDVTVGRVPSNT